MAKQKDPNARIKNRQSDLIQNITNRYRVTAREARDIVTAVGTAGNVLKNKKAVTGQRDLYPSVSKPVVKNVIRQVKETGRAALTGKSGTKSDQLKKKNPNRPYSNSSREGMDRTFEYKKGASRNSRKMVKKPIK
jgi:hypothetical protein